VGSLIALTVAVARLVAGPIPDPDIADFQRLLFATPLAGFVVAATSSTPPTLDWSTDHCSAPLIGNTGRSFDFTNSCRRHDFAYRNLKRFDQRQPGMWWNTQWRHKVDAQFRRDLRSECDGRPLSQRVTCRWWAEIFFRAVRTFGGP
jgi:hypothetical protein